jgi:hypothetical protein
MGQKTAGHSTAQGGLRGHSMGGGYPETVIGIGDGFALFNTLTGDTGPVRATYDEARFYRELDQPCPGDCPRVRGTLCHSCDWFTSARPDEVRGRLLLSH